MTVRPVLEIDLRAFTKPGEKIPNYPALSRKLSGFDLPGGAAINLRVYGFEVFEENLDWVRPDFHVQPCSADWANAMEWTRAIYRIQRGEAA